MADIETIALDTRYFAEAAAPGTPDTGKAVVYVKTDGRLYLKDDAGTETDLTSGGGSTLPDGTADGQVLTWQDANVEVAKAWPGTPDLVSGLIDYARDNALAGTATWSSSYDSLATYDGNKAIDANIGTSWATNSPTGQWWQYDFGDGYGVKVTHWAIFQHSFDGYQPTEFTIQGSNDGSSWVVLYTHDGTYTATSTWQSGAVDAYSDTVFRYIKIVPTATKSGGNGVGFAEIEFWGTHVTIVQGQWAAEAPAVPPALKVYMYENFS